MSALLTEEIVRDRLQALITESGKPMSEWAKDHEIDKSGLSRILSGERPPNDMVLKILGLTRAMVYIQERDHPKSW